MQVIKRLDEIKTVCSFERLFFEFAAKAAPRQIRDASVLFILHQLIHSLETIPVVRNSHQTMSWTWLFALFGLYATVRLVYCIVSILQHRTRQIKEYKTFQQLEQTNSLPTESVSPQSDNDSKLQSIEPKKAFRIKPVRTMIILGSGGHTTEMLTIIDALDKTKHYNPRYFVYANSDTSSLVRTKQKYHSSQDIYLSIPRSRQVGQSYVTSIFTTIWSFVYSSFVVLMYQPELVLTNGPGTCFPIVMVCLIFEILFFKKITLVFIESFCRCKTLSLSGFLLYPCVHRFIVQWEQLAHKYKYAEYIGQIC